MLNLRGVAALVAAGALISLHGRAYAADNASLPADDGGEWIQLFNGKDLTGWTPKIVGHAAGDNFADTFRVKEGVLCVSYDDYDGPFADRFGHLFYKEPFSNYLLRLEYRLVGEQYPGGPEWGYANSGVMLHGQSPESMGRDQFFPVSIEAQFLAGRRGPTGNACSPGTHIVIDGKLFTTHCTDRTKKVYPLGEWVAVELEVHGDKLIRHKINGETVLEYSGTQLDEKDPDAQKLLAAGASREVTGGTISLQSESHPIEFRKIELKRLAE
ncbi:MAG: DUF1080 domain-containing protein [Pirellulales bacterium]